MKRSCNRTSDSQVHHRRRCLVAAALGLSVFATLLGGCTVRLSHEESTVDASGTWSPDRTGWTRGNRGGGDR